MRRDDDGAVAAEQARPRVEKRVEHRLGVVGVEVLSRFVQKYNLGRRQQGTCEQKAAPLPR